MKRLSRRAIMVLLAIATTTVTSACATPIAKIKDSPDRFVGTVVRIAGTVEKSLKVPFVGVSVLTVVDRGASILVLSTSEHPVGETVRFRAKVFGVTEAESVGKSQKVIDGISSFLVDHNFAKKGNADNAAAAVLRVIGAIGGKLEGSYFLIEQPDNSRQ